MSQKAEVMSIARRLGLRSVGQKKKAVDEEEEHHHPPSPPLVVKASSKEKKKIKKKLKVGQYEKKEAVAAEDQGLAWCCSQYTSMHAYREDEFTKPEKAEKNKAKKARLANELKEFNFEWIAALHRFTSKHYPELVEHEQPHSLSRFSMVWRLKSRDSFLKLIFLDKYARVPVSEFDSELKIALRLGRVARAPEVLSHGFYPDHFGWIETTAAVCSVHQLRKHPETYPLLDFSDKHLGRNIAALIEKIAAQHVLLYDVKLHNFVVTGTGRLQAIDFSGNWSFYRPWMTCEFLQRCMHFFAWTIMTKNSEESEQMISFPDPEEHVKFDQYEHGAIKKMMKDDEFDVLLGNYCDDVPVKVFLAEYIKTFGFRDKKKLADYRE